MSTGLALDGHINMTHSLICETANVKEEMHTLQAEIERLRRLVVELLRNNESLREALRQPSSQIIS